jgi:hypothetical protein
LPKAFLHKEFYASRMRIRKNGKFVSKTPDHRDSFVKTHMVFCLLPQRQANQCLPDAAFKIK